MISFTNSKNGMTIFREEPKDEEYVYTGKPLIVETDLDGFIVYANRRFIEISGYTKEELIGSPHCMHLHPYMPEAIFQEACRITSEGKIWSGYMQNIAKNGICYWTEMIIQPKMDESGKIVGYLATRKAPDPDAIAKVIKEFEDLRNSKENQKSQFCGEVYMNGRGACRY